MAQSDRATNVVEGGSGYGSGRDWGAGGASNGGTGGGSGHGRSWEGKTKSVKSQKPPPLLL